MEGIHTLKLSLQKGDLMCKIDLKDAYFVILLREGSSNL